MNVVPGLPADQLVLAKHEHHGIALTRGPDRLGDQPLIGLRVAEDGVLVHLPVTFLVQRQLAPFGIRHLELLPGELPDPLQHAHPLHGDR